MIRLTCKVGMVAPLAAMVVGVISPNTTIFEPVDLCPPGYQVVSAGCQSIQNPQAPPVPPPPDSSRRATVWTLDSAQDCGTETNKRVEKQPNKPADSTITVKYKDESTKKPIPDYPEGNHHPVKEIAKKGTSDDQASSRSCAVSLAIALEARVSAATAIAETYCGQASSGARVFVCSSYTSCEFAISTAEA